MRLFGIFGIFAYFVTAFTFFCVAFCILCTFGISVASDPGLLITMTIHCNFLTSPKCSASLPYYIFKRLASVTIATIIAFLLHNFWDEWKVRKWVDGYFRLGFISSIRKWHKTNGALKRKRASSLWCLTLTPNPLSEGNPKRKTWIIGHNAWAHHESNSTLRVIVVINVYRRKSCWRAPIS